MSLLGSARLDPGLSAGEVQGALWGLPVWFRVLFYHLIFGGAVAVHKWGHAIRRRQSVGLIGET